MYKNFEEVSWKEAGVGVAANIVFITGFMAVILVPLAIFAYAFDFICKLF